MSEVRTGGKTLFKQLVIYLWQMGYMNKIDVFSTLEEETSRKKLAVQREKENN